MINSDDFIIVWLDDNQDKTIDHWDTKQCLQYLIQYLRIFNNPDECIDFITSQRMNIFFLTSETMGKITIPHVHELSTIVSIYILSQSTEELIQNFSKITGMFIDKNRLVSRLVVDIARYTHTTISISLLEKDAIKSIRDLNKEHASFMWSQLLIEILLKMDQMDIAKNEMIHECSSQYEVDLVEQVKIEDFRSNYNTTKAIWWYTRDCFLYRLLNKALRTEDIDIIFKFRFFIKELFYQLKDASDIYTQELIECDIDTLSLFRGQNITFNEFQELKKCANGLISFNTFLSTTIDRAVAVVYAGDGSGTPEIESVLFEIVIHMNIKKTKPFANIKNLKSIEKLIDLNIWHVKMTLCDDHDEQLNAVLDYLKNKLHETTDVFTLGRFLIQIGDFKRAEAYYNRLLIEISPSNSLQYATICNQFGLLHQRKCEYVLALEQYKKALEILSQYPSIDNEILSNIYDNMATAYDDMGQSDQALVHSKKKTLQFKETIKDDLSLGITYSNMAVTYDQLGDYENAMINHEKSLEILSRLPTYHPNLAITCGNLGATFRNIGDGKKSIRNV
ncbi:unnamed protein product [Rotaria magnacalcarata]|uniref:TPR repeat-containing protein n=1 Tax=Rotaria magnacalcarata TaxID=392030 RepID=A0A819Q180_9BILA|nr:unnamed protein product [Rotaria magnacalcarata]CAF4023928.1 unnamed protein product [Rotaria magnacalcarata]